MSNFYLSPQPSTNLAVSFSQENTLKTSTPKFWRRNSTYNTIIGLGSLIASCLSVYSAYVISQQSVTIKGLTDLVSQQRTTILEIQKSNLNLEKIAVASTAQSRKIAESDSIEGLVSKRQIESFLERTDNKLSGDNGEISRYTVTASMASSCQNWDHVVKSTEALGLEMDNVNIKYLFTHTKEAALWNKVRQEIKIKNRLNDCPPVEEMMVAQKALIQAREDVIQFIKMF